MSKKYYNEDLCNSDGGCKLYNPLQTQGKCKYYNEWCEQLDKISALESKLAKFNSYKTDDERIRDLTNLYVQYKKENEELKQQLSELEIKNDKLYADLFHTEDISNYLQQQLAEKEKELHHKTAECEKWKADYENCSKLEKMMTKERQYCLDNWRASEQDKISFAVEQLKKVKEFVKETSGIVGHEWRIDRFRVLDNIDNQIKALKEGK